jgi:hypothetical protein
MNEVRFLIRYNRKAGQIVSIQRFSDAEKAQADGVRLQLELDLLRRQQKDEVVLLDAASEEALRKTHRRYFEDLAALAGAL